jgi:hypothetical protein
VRASPGSTVVVGDRRGSDRNLAIGILGRLISSVTVVGAVELHVLNASVTLDTSRLLKTAGEILVDHAENGDLALNNLLLLAVGHVSRDVVDEALLGTIVKDLLPQDTRSVEVLGTNLRKECDGISGKVAVNLVNIKSALAERHGLDGRQVVWSGTLVVEGHATITLEVCNAVGCARSVDGQLLVVDTDAVTVGVGVREET